VYEITQNEIDYVKKIIHKKFGVYEDNYLYDLLYSEGLVALTKCAKKFDDTKGTKFTTYAYKALLHSMYDAISSKYANEFRHNTEDDYEVQEETYNIDLDEVSQEERDVFTFVRAMPKVDQRIFFDFVAGVSPKVTYTREGIHETTLHRARKKIFKRLRECLEKRE